MIRPTRNARVRRFKTRAPLSSTRRTTKQVLAGRRIMRTWIIALLLYAVAALGGYRRTEPSDQFVERVVANAERSSPFEKTEQSQSANARECCKVCTKGTRVLQWDASGSRGQCAPACFKCTQRHRRKDRSAYYKRSTTLMRAVRARAKSKTLSISSASTSAIL